AARVEFDRSAQGGGRLRRHLGVELGHLRRAAPYSGGGADHRRNPTRPGTRQASGPLAPDPVAVRLTAARRLALRRPVPRPYNTGAACPSRGPSPMLTRPNTALSQIHMQIMWSRLIAVVEEQAQTLVRTAFSTPVREAGDLSAGVFD